MNYGLTSLAYAAREAGAQLAMYGHTHVPDYQDWGGVQILNPGTAGRGRSLTWALVTVYDNGGIVCEKVAEGKGNFGYNAATDTYEDLVKSIWG